MEKRGNGETAATAARAARDALTHARLAAWADALFAAVSAFATHPWIRLGRTLGFVPGQKQWQDARAAAERWPWSRTECTSPAHLEREADFFYTALEQCFRIWERSWWWRSGVGVRTLAARMGLRKADFHLPPDDIRPILEAIARWRRGARAERAEEAAGCCQAVASATAWSCRRPVTAGVVLASGPAGEPIRYYGTRKAPAPATDYCLVYRGDEPPADPVVQGLVEAMETEPEWGGMTVLVNGEVRAWMVRREALLTAEQTPAAFADHEACLAALAEAGWEAPTRERDAFAVSNPEAWPARGPAEEAAVFQAFYRKSYYAGQVEALVTNMEALGLHARLSATAQALPALLSHARRQGERPLVSVIMPAYNRAALLVNAVRTVREQTWPHWELLVCDDGSTDETAVVVKGLGEPRLRYLSLPHRGAAAARNAGLAEAQGTYIAYLDTDNLWHPAYLEAMLAVLRGAPGTLFAYADYVDVDVGAPDGPTLRPWPPRDFSYARLIEQNYIDLNTLMHHRSAYDTFGGFTESLPRFQDWDLALRYFSRESPCYVELALARYTRNAALGQISHGRAFDTKTAEFVRGQEASYYERGVVQPEAKDEVFLVTLADARDPIAVDKAYALIDAWRRAGRPGHAVTLLEHEADAATVESLAQAGLVVALDSGSGAVAAQAAPNAPLLYSTSDPGEEGPGLPFPFVYAVDEQGLRTVLADRPTLRRNWGFDAEDQVLALARGNGGPPGQWVLEATAAAGWKTLVLAATGQNAGGAAVCRVDTPADAVSAAAVADAVIYSGTPHTRLPDELPIFFAAEVPVLAPPAGPFLALAREGAIIECGKTGYEGLTKQLSQLAETAPHATAAAKRYFSRRFSDGALCDRIDLFYHAATTPGVR